MINELDELQDELDQWRQHNFPIPTHRDYNAQFKGVVEELGEYAHHSLKLEQGIRGDENHYAEMMDAVGDMLIFLMGLCTAHGWSLGGILETTAQEVMKRDWRRDPISGGGTPPMVD